MKLGDIVFFRLPKEFFDSEWVNGEAHFGNTSLTFNDFMVIKTLIGFERTFKIEKITGEGAVLEGLEGEWPLELLAKHTGKEVK